MIEVNTIHIALISVIVSVIGLAGTIISVYISMKTRLDLHEHRIGVVEQNATKEAAETKADLKEMETYFDKKFSHLEEKIESMVKALIELSVTKK